MLRLLQSSTALIVYVQVAILAWCILLLCRWQQHFNFSDFHKDDLAQGCLEVVLTYLNLARFAVRVDSFTVSFKSFACCDSHKLELVAGR